MTISIVIVDDNEVDRYVLIRHLKKLAVDCRIIEFTDGDEFVDVVLDDDARAREIGVPPPPILVLLDINMPRMDGFEVLEELNKKFHDFSQIISVTMYTSSSQAEDRADAARYPFVNGYITKPVARERLVQLLEDLYPNR